jgi:hypothetical protein
MCAPYPVAIVELVYGFPFRSTYPKYLDETIQYEIINEFNRGTAYYLSSLQLPIEPKEGSIYSDAHTIRFAGKHKYLTP